MVNSFPLLGADIEKQQLIFAQSGDVSPVGRRVRAKESPSEPGRVETWRVLRLSSCRGRNGSRGADGVFQSTELALRYACEKVLPVHGQPKYSSCHRDGTGKQNIFHPASNCRNIPPADCSSQEVRGGDCFRRPKLPRDEVDFGVCDAKAQVCSVGKPAGPLSSAGSQACETLPSSQFSRQSQIVQWTIS